MTADADDFDAIVYDLDGTLVHLDVDWGAAEADVAAVLAARGVEVETDDPWAMLERADATGHRDAVEAVLADHERPGAETSRRLALADDLPRTVPVGVCSLNCEAACHAALATHGLADAVDAVVGRDSVATEKPDPEPLVETIRRLGADPDRTLFVGDSERDEETAARAGVAFAYAEAFASPRSV